jgi:hypothetical protein
MTIALWLLAIVGAIGAFDTFYYHEWLARLPSQPGAAPELRLHAARDLLYAVLFGALPLLAWHGLWLVVLAAVIVAEIVLTLWDFVVEIAVRKPLGDVYAGERVTHAVIGILYGAMVANLVPALSTWWPQPTALRFLPPPVPRWLQWSLLAMAAGVTLSGFRDLYAAFGLPYGSWPWKPASPAKTKGCP